MAVTITYGGEQTTNVLSFSVQEDATPIDPSSSAGGVGTITISGHEDEDSHRLLGAIVLADGSRGKTSGVVREVNGRDGVLTITADSILGLFNSDRTIAPFVGTFHDAIQFYCDTVGIPNDVVVDATVANRQVVYPGWGGNVWVMMKQIMVREQVEMALVFDRVYVRPLRKLHVNQDRMMNRGWTVSNTTAAKAIDINYYNHVSGQQMTVYPIPGEEPQTFVVNAGETQEIEIPLHASLSSVNQPGLLTSVPNSNFDGTSGVYSVVGNDDLPITAAQWAAQGGSLSVSLTNDPSVIKVTIVGASNTTYAPYRVAVSSGSGTYYNSLHITGTGVRWDKKTLRLPTGATNLTTSEEVGTTIDNVFIRTESEAYNLGAKAAGTYAGIGMTVNATALDVNRDSAARDLIQATVGDFNTVVAPATSVASFNTSWANKKVSDFNAYWREYVDLMWENQLFGNVTGARMKWRNSYFRVVSATTNQESVQFDATMDTLVSDFNEVWSSATVAQFNADWFGQNARALSLDPLKSSIEVV